MSEQNRPPVLQSVNVFGAVIADGVDNELPSSVGAQVDAVAAAATLRFGSDFMQSPRVEAATVGSNNNSTNNNNSNNNNNNNNNNTIKIRTIRLDLELFQTDSCSYPEFNYAKLIRLEKKKIKKLKQNSSSKIVGDPFEDNDEEVARIAKKLEEKYGTDYSSKRGRIRNSDKGLGYDETDSFIDNSEAYDEIIPEEVETIEGGFYINSGALEFTKPYADPLPTKTDEIIKMPNRPKKRVLSSSSEDSSSSDDDDEDDDDDDDDDDSDDDEFVENGTHAGHAPTKKPKHITLDATSHAKKRPENGRKKLREGMSNSSSNSPKPQVGGEEHGSDSEKERARQLSLKSVKTTTVKDMLKAKRDHFLKQVGSGEAKTINGDMKVTPGDNNAAADNEESSSDETDMASVGIENSDSNASAPQHQREQKSKKGDEKAEKLRSKDTSLPTLEKEVIAIINDFRDLVKLKQLASGKRLQFDDHLSVAFLKLDELLLCQKKTVRTMVFAHLEFHLLLPKYYFLRKSKQLNVREEKMKSKRSLGKLRKAIIEAMPGVIADYEVQLRNYLELQKSNPTAQMPMKVFPWTDTLRKLLYDVHRVRWTSFPALGARKESLEEFIYVYMRDKVVELWPSGWMNYEALQLQIKKKDELKAKEKQQREQALDVNPVTAAGKIATAVALKTVPDDYATITPTGTTVATATSTLSCANSDTDSVASSSTSGGVKRRNKDTNSKPSNRSKAPRRSNGTESQKHFSSTSAIDLSTPTIQSYIHPVMMPTSMAAATSVTASVVPTIAAPANLLAPATSSILGFGPNTFSAASSSASAASSLNQKHSKAEPQVRVIDLDKFRTTSDILETSKQLLGATTFTTGPTSSALANMQQQHLQHQLPKVQQQPRSLPSAAKKAARSDSSSESDGVEIVGYYMNSTMSNTTMSESTGRVGTGLQQNNAAQLLRDVPNAHMLAAAGVSVTSVTHSSKATTSGVAFASSATTANNNNNTSNNNSNKSSKIAGGVHLGQSSFNAAHFNATLLELEKQQKSLIAAQFASLSANARDPNAKPHSTAKQ